MIEPVILENCTLYHADCRDILPLLPKVDAVIADPPYGIASCWKGGGGHGWANVKDSTAERNKWDAEAPGKEIFDLLLSIGKVQAFWGGNYFDLPVSRGWLVWNKPERNFTLSEAELCWTSLDMAIRVFDYRRSDSDRVHPTQKPVSVMTWTIQKMKVLDGNIVLDPFMGSGTTGVAAIRMGCKFIGIEKDPKYFEIAVKRIKEELSQLRLPL